MTNTEDYPSLEEVRTRKRPKTVKAIVIAEIGLALYFAAWGLSSVGHPYIDPETSNCISSALGEIIHDVLMWSCAPAILIVLLIAAATFRGRQWTRVLTIIINVPVIFFAGLILMSNYSELGSVVSLLTLVTSCACITLLNRRQTVQWFTRRHAYSH